MQALLITGWPAMKCKYESISVIRAPETAGSDRNNKKNTTKKISKNQKSSKKKKLKSACLIESTSLFKLLTCAHNFSFSLLKNSIYLSAAVMTENKHLINSEYD